MMQVIPLRNVVDKSFGNMIRFCLSFARDHRTDLSLSAYSAYVIEKKRPKRQFIPCSEKQAKRGKKKRILTKN